MPRLWIILAASLAMGQTARRDASLTGVSQSVIYLEEKVLRIDVTAQIDVRESAGYSLTAELRAANGTSLTARNRERLEAGSRSLTASIYAFDIRKTIGQDGPYEILDVRLFKELGNVPVLVDSRNTSLRTAAVRLKDLYLDLPSFTGEIEVRGVDPMPSGKFRVLRVDAMVVTPGGKCSASASLADESGRHIASVLPAEPWDMPPGKGVLPFEFNGAKIGHRSGDEPLIVSGLSIGCGNALSPAQRPIPTGVIHTSEFDDSAPDVELVLGEVARVAAGDPALPNIRIRLSGGLESVSEIKARAEDARLNVAGLPNGFYCGSSTCWREGVNGLIRVQTPNDIESGMYAVNVVVRAGDIERTARVQFLVDEELTRHKREAAAALDRLKDLDSVPPAPPSQAPPEFAPEEPPKIIYSAGVGLRKIHAVLVLGRNGSMGPTCSFMTAAATRFAHTFVDGRDSLGVIAYDHSVATLLPMTERFWEAAPARFEAIRCSGATNTGGALEAAQRELEQHEDSEAINAVILFADHPPNSISAVWPARPQPNGAMCAEAKNGQVPATLVGTGDLTGALFVPAGSNQLDLPLNMPGRSCFPAMGNRYLANYAYIPEQDSNGVSFGGARPLERFTDGPYVAKIRLDRLENVRSAAANQVEHVAQSLRTRRNPTFVYVVGFSSGGRLGPLDWLKAIANDPSGPAFRSDQPAGLAVVADDPAAFTAAFQRVRDDIVKHATVQ
jgi:hypothetical protein